MLDVTIANMHVLKKIGLFISVGFLPLLIFYLVFAYGFNNTIGNIDYVKDSLQESGIYKETAEIIVKQSTKDAPSEKIVARSIKKAASTNNIQKIAEPVITGFYKWLEGDTKDLKFDLDIKPIKKTFVSTYKINLKKYIADLPTCTTYENLDYNDISKITCLPPDIDANQVVNQAIDQAVNNNDVFSDNATSDGRLSSKDTKEAGLSSPVDNPPTIIPDLYRFIKASWPYAIVLTLLSVIGVIFLSKSKMYGAKKIGITLIVSSVWLIISGILMKLSVDNFLPATDPNDNQVPTESIINLIKTLFADISNIWLWPGVSLFIIGIILVTVVHHNLKQPKQTKTL